MGANNIWLAAADGDETAVLRFLASNPSAVNSLDENGYTTLHAAASYNHDSLLRKLVLEHAGNVNLEDFDGETPLFVTETVHIAKVLVEELHADPNHRNHENMTAADVIERDGDFPLVAAYLRTVEQQSTTSTATPLTSNNNNSNPQSAIYPGPSPNMPVRLTTEEDVTGELPLIDEDLRRRIEELASRPNFESKEVQEELRNLVKDALQGHVIDQENGERSVRQRREGDGN